MALAGSTTNNLTLASSGSETWYLTDLNLTGGAGCGTLRPGLRVLNNVPSLNESDVLIFAAPEPSDWGALTLALKQDGASIQMKNKAAGLPAVAANEYLWVTDLTQVVVVKASGAPTVCGSDACMTRAQPTTPNFDLQPGALVMKMHWLAYRVNHDAFGTGSMDPALEVADLPGSNTTVLLATAEPAAAGIEDLQVAFAIDNGNGDGGSPNGRIGTEIGSAGNDDEWIYNHSGDTEPTCAEMANIKAVRITLVARSTVQRQGQFSAANRRPKVEDHAAAVSSDGFYRVRLQQIISLRNKGS